MRSPPPGYELSLVIRSQLVRIFLAIMLLAIAFLVFASETSATVDAPDWLQLSLGLFGGLALFLAGLQELSEGMKKAAGEALKRYWQNSRLTVSREP